jgi:hypothetical protein
MKFDELLRVASIPIAPTNHKHARYGWVQFDCPYCGRGSRRYHMGYNTGGRYVNCWRCGRRDLADVISLLLNISIGQAKRHIVDLPVLRARRTFETRGTLHPPTGTAPLHPAHCAYLRDRGFDPEGLVRLWGIRGTSITARLPWRIYIPIYLDGEEVSWTTRAIAPEVERRYVGAGKHEEAVPAKSLLYGMDYARHAIIIHEGPTDVWATGPGAVATMGQDYSRAQVEWMARYLVRATCFDNVPDAQRRARRLADLLAVFPGETMNIVLSGKDAATSPRSEIQRMRREVLGDVDGL